MALTTVSFSVIFILIFVVPQPLQSRDIRQDPQITTEVPIPQVVCPSSTAAFAINKALLTFRLSAIERQLQSLYRINQQIQNQSQSIIDRITKNQMPFTTPKTKPTKLWSVEMTAESMSTQSLELTSQQIPESSEKTPENVSEDEVEAKSAGENQFEAEVEEESPTFDYLRDRLYILLKRVPILARELREELERRPENQDWLKLLTKMEAIGRLLTVKEEIDEYLDENSTLDIDYVLKVVFPRVIEDMRTVSNGVEHDEDVRGFADSLCDFWRYYNNQQAQENPNHEGTSLSETLTCLEDRN